MSTDVRSRPIATAGSRSWASLVPLLFPVLMLVALFVIPPLADREANAFSVYNSLQSLAGLGLVALALGLTMIIGEFDLSVVGTFALGGMLAVKLGEQSPVTGVLVAIVVCALLGLVQGIVVALLGVNSMAITLGGYLLSLGVAGTIGDNKSQPYGNLDLSARLNEPIAQVLSVRSLVALAVMAGVIGVLAATRIGRDMRATGGGRRASRTAGVRVDAIVIGTFVASAGLAALGGSLQSYGVATAASNPGLSPLIFAVTATLLGGVALSGGRGTAFGVVAGATGLCFFNQLFSTMATPQYVISLLTGALLIAATVLTTPAARRGLARVRRARA
ncbi:ABC transporter permease [Aeromicrobium sp. CFBP 8757]|uniref:ABC transporter permease n=1 Tax=Aeromicrobium sp. CFBP 8757 TaxID=2775288 RepID=UPI00178670C6|nr:ABC transporter permease [Aeromicrobium sp. CFBP 8757]MBD8605536.1 ABC transporter permease [Aeromicrobium sp. CFBP 8757]